MVYGTKKNIARCLKFEWTKIAVLQGENGAAEKDKQKGQSGAPETVPKPSRLEGQLMTVGYRRHVAERWRDDEYLVNLPLAMLL
jgi:hypothetical protein